MLSVSAFGLVRLSLGLALPDVPLGVPGFYLPLSGGSWALTGLVVACGLVTGTPWAPFAARVGAIAVAGWYWSDRLFLVRSDYARQTWPASLLVTLAALGFVFWSLRRPESRRFFEETPA